MAAFALKADSTLSPTLLVPLSMFFVCVSAYVQLCLGLCRRFCLWPGWGHCDNEGRKVGTLTDTCPSKFPAITFKGVCSRPPGAANHHLYNEQSQITCFFQRTNNILNMSPCWLLSPTRKQLSFPTERTPLSKETYNNSRQLECPNCQIAPGHKRRQRLNVLTIEVQVDEWFLDLHST